MTCFLLTFYITICISTQNDLHNFFLAIQRVETPQGIDLSLNEDHIGPYQVSYDYWLDSGVPGRWEDCEDKAYSEQVMMAYWKRYVSEAFENRNYEVLARTHYGGPNGAKKESTVMYWQLVKKELKNAS